MGRTIRRAEKADLKAIMQVLEAAKKIMRDSGNMNQWINGYPSEEVVLNDMAIGWGHVVVDDGRITDMDRTSVHLGERCCHCHCFYDLLRRHRPH